MPGEEFPTTNEDLAGFWDMVMLQVVQVNELFDQIEKLRKLQWQEVWTNNIIIDIESASNFSYSFLYSFFSIKITFFYNILIFRDYTFNTLFYMHIGRARQESRVGLATER